MPTVQMRENLAIAYGSNAPFAALFTSATTGTAPGTEVTGGTPAYARKALTWAPGTVDGTVTATVTFDVPTGVTVVGAGVYTAATAGSYLDGGSVPSQTFSSQGTYTLTITYNQS